MKTDKDSIASPCIKQCALDVNKICLGCFRSIDEITTWSKVDAQTRLSFFNKC